MDFTFVPKEYRPIPFWSWNEKLDVEETKKQIRLMDEAGIGGFFMHARGGLQTPYMGEEWFKNVTASVEEAKKRGMRLWAYDENGWPSGFGSGLVNGLGIEYQQKYLRMEKEPVHKETAICKCGEHYFYYDVNPFYVDTLDKKVIAKFIEVAYKPYYERYGTKIEGFFTDEPQISRSGIPWSFVFREEYEKRYGEDIYEHLEELYLEIGEYKEIRVKFWKMVTELFSEAFMKQIHEQCKEWGVKLTGHLVLEETLLSQLLANGACMPHYEYLDIPGMDWLGRDIRECLTPLQVSSVAEQMGQDSVISETFALCGHNVSFAELKGMYEWQMVHGINLLCQHLEGYSIRGIRKRDYPPAMYVQQPWWAVYDKLVDALSRESMILARGGKRAEVLLLHPMTTAWSLYNTTNNDVILELNQRFIDTIKELERKHIIFHLGDEIMLERHGRVEGDRLVIGKQSYVHVIDSCCGVLLPRTKELLAEYQQNGGHMATAKELPVNDIINHPEITYTRRLFDGAQVHYFVNTSAEEKSAEFKVGGKVIDIYSGELTEFGGQHTFEPWGSLMILEDETQMSEAHQVQASEADVCAKAATATEVQSASQTAPKTVPKTLCCLSDICTIAGKVQNSLTLDRCDYYFDGELQEKNGYVLNICERANKLERPVQIHQEYHVQMKYVPEELYLVCETPEKFNITINGKELTSAPEGYFVDKSFQKISVAEYMQCGENTICFDCDFVQSEEFYENLRRSYVFESEKNKLAYDMEIESVYLVGDFSVRTDGEWTELEKNAVRYHGSFVIDAPKREITITHMERQGYPFFCGEMVLEGEIEISGENPVLRLQKKGITAVKVEIGEAEKWMLTNNELSLKVFGIQGKIKVKLTLLNNLRNLLGPHHLKEGEAYRVMPGSFYKEACVWNRAPEAGWDDDYCFVEMSL